MISPSILLSEQNHELRILATEALSSAGFRVISSGSYDDTLQILRDGLRPACILLDVNLTATLCLEYISSIRYITNQVLPLVLISGRLDLPLLARECGAHWTLAKPYELEALVLIAKQASALV